MKSQDDSGHRAPREPENAKGGASAGRSLMKVASNDLRVRESDKQDIKANCACLDT